MERHLAARKDPALLLKKASQELRGKLTVFLGAAAGVGKTYAMLESAKNALAGGKKVMIGWLETHGRKETEAMAKGLPRLAARELEYRGKRFEEMDIDAILAQKPQIVLVDELAHTNIVGSRHVRRYQDVEEILAAGIDVYTTLNIQHVESVNDIVEQITQVKVQETVPDSILEAADQVRLIDISPEELQKRLQEGKVYVKGQAERALQNFFRPGNINALREMALRFTANRVDQQMNEYMHDHAISGPWAATDKILVCVSASPFSTHLIRAAKRMARAMKAQWYAIYVENPDQSALSAQDHGRLMQNLHLAAELGGKTATLSGRDMTEEVIAFAKEENVTHIIVGKPLKSQWRDWLRGGAFVDKLIRSSGGIHIHVIQGKRSAASGAKVKVRAAGSKQAKWHYAAGLLMLALVTLFCRVMPDFELVNVAMLYLLPVLLSAAWWGRGPSYMTAVFAVAGFDYLFIPPVLSFNVMDIRYVWSFIIFLLVAFIAGGQTEKVRREAHWAHQREKVTRSLYDFSREVASLVEEKEVVEKLVEAAGKALTASVVVLLPDSAGKLVEIASRREDGDSRDGKSLEESELAVAIWVFENGQPAGKATDTLPSAQYLYLPLQVQNRCIGVLGLEYQELTLTAEQKRLIDAWAAMAAMVLERIQLTKDAAQAALLSESEKLRMALLNSVSHELRTPLATILGSISILLDQEMSLAPEDRWDLQKNIQAGAKRMERIVVNLLDIARLESGAMKIKNDWCDMEEIVGAALQHLRDFIQTRTIKIEVSEDVPLFRGDCVLLEQVLINLIDNAVKYSPEDSEIWIQGQVEIDHILVFVTDQGNGIAEAELSRIFEKFYRAKQQSTVAGTGLGLSICQGIVEAHGGKIWAVNLPEGGASFRFSLPFHPD